MARICPDKYYKQEHFDEKSLNYTVIKMNRDGGILDTFEQKH